MNLDDVLNRDVPDYAQHSDQFNNCYIDPNLLDISRSPFTLPADQYPIVTDPPPFDSGYATSNSGTRPDGGFTIDDQSAARESAYWTRGTYAVGDRYPETSSSSREWNAQWDTFFTNYPNPPTSGQHATRLPITPEQRFPQRRAVAHAQAHPGTSTYAQVIERQSSDFPTAGVHGYSVSSRSQLLIPHTSLETSSSVGDYVPPPGRRTYAEAAMSHSRHHPHKAPLDPAPSAALDAWWPERIFNKRHLGAESKYISQNQDSLESDWKCPICGSLNKRVYELNRHLETIHTATQSHKPPSERVVSCGCCCRTFTDFKEWSKHVSGRACGLPRPWLVENQILGLLRYSMSQSAELKKKLEAQALTASTYSGHAPSESEMSKLLHELETSFPITSAQVEMSIGLLARRGLCLHHILDESIIAPPGHCRICAYSGFAFISQRETVTRESPEPTEGPRRMPGRNAGQYEDGYICDHPGCTAKYDTRSSLTKHQRYHVPSEERPHRCNVCTRSFFYPKDLARHMKTHKHTSRIYCPMPDCRYHQRGFNRRDHLKRHMSRRHPDSTYLDPGSPSPSISSARSREWSPAHASRSFITPSGYAVGRSQVNDTASEPVPEVDRGTWLL